MFYRQEEGFPLTWCRCGESIGCGDSGGNKRRLWHWSTDNIIRRVVWNLEPLPIEGTVAVVPDQVAMVSRQDVVPLNSARREETHIVYIGKTWLFHLELKIVGLKWITIKMWRKQGPLKKNPICYQDCCAPVSAVGWDWITALHGVAVKSIRLRLVVELGQPVILYDNPVYINDLTLLIFC